MSRKLSKWPLSTLNWPPNSKFGFWGNMELALEEFSPKDCTIWLQLLWKSLTTNSSPCRHSIRLMLFHFCICFHYKIQKEMREFWAIRHFDDDCLFRQQIGSSTSPISKEKCQSKNLKMNHFLRYFWLIFLVTILWFCQIIVISTENDKKPRETKIIKK